MIEIKIGDIFESKKEVLVNTVNCVGVMGKGIALTFKRNYPDMFYEYASNCQKGIIKPGHIYPYYKNEKVMIINFSTKDHWRNNSKIEYVINGLKQFESEYKQLGIKSIAFPPLGCGNGNLEWSIVGPIMYQSLSKLDIDVEIYAPFGTNSKFLSIEYLSKQPENRNTYKKDISVNPNWYLALQITKELNESKYNVIVGRTVFQKIFYILNVFGVDMGVEFVKGTYGPYSAQINNVVSYFANNNYIVEKSIGKLCKILPTKNFVINFDNYNKLVLEKYYKALNFMRGIRNTNEAEMVTSIIYSADDLKKQGVVIDKNKVIEYLLNWKTKYNNNESIELITDIYDYLMYSKTISN